MSKSKKQNTDVTAEEMAFMNATGKLEYTLMNDYLFHVVMQRNEKVLRGLIGSLLSLTQDEIVSVELKNPIVPGQAVGDKEIILDLMIILNGERFLNIEMQVNKQKYWEERSLIYLCRNFDNLSQGDNYSKVMPCLHIGIIDFDLFEGMSEFYSRYRIRNIRDGRIYTDKFGINVLNLKCIGNATDDDKENELDAWARLFKAKTWEEIKMIASQHDFAKEAANSIYAVSSDEAIRLQCEARERYERDWANSYESGFETGFDDGFKDGYKDGFEGGFKDGVEQEQANTKREKMRADEAEQRCIDVVQKYNATELKLSETSKQLEAALKEIERLKAGEA